MFRESILEVEWRMTGISMSRRSRKASQKGDVQVSDSGGLQQAQGAMWEVSRME